MDELIDKIQAETGFSIKATPVPSGSGYKLRLQAQWDSMGSVTQFRVQLAGLNPLTGCDVMEEKISYIFSFEQQTTETPTMRYHGQYTLLCFATLTTGEEILFKEQPLTLKCNSSIPFLSYRIQQNRNFWRRPDGFWTVTLQSNCWPYCKNKIWLHFDEHDQLVPIPKRCGDTFTFYLATADEPTVNVTDKTIVLRKEK